MRYEVQVHFENKGNVTWFEDIHDPCEYEDLFFTEVGRAYAEGEGGRRYFICLKTVIALVLTEAPLPIEEQPDAA